MNQIRYQESKSTALSVDITKECEFFRQAVLSVEPRFDTRKADRNILNSVFAWVWRLDACNLLGLDYDKGLFLTGAIGRGKSTTLRALRTYIIGVKSRMDVKDNRLGTYWRTASQLANAYAAEGQMALGTFYSPECCLFIDELGREPNPANNFGTKMNVLQFLLQMRYDNRRTGVTHVTTNLGVEEIADYYGAYVADRCVEMFNFIEFKGESLRK